MYKIKYIYLSGRLVINFAEDTSTSRNDAMILPPFPCNQWPNANKVWNVKERHILRCCVQNASLQNVPFLAIESHFWNRLLCWAILTFFIASKSALLIRLSMLSNLQVSRGTCWHPRALLSFSHVHNASLLPGSVRRLLYRNTQFVPRILYKMCIYIYTSRIVNKQCCRSMGRKKIWNNDVCQPCTWHMYLFKYIYINIF